MVYILSVVCQATVTAGIILEKDWLKKIGLAGHLALMLYSALCIIAILAEANSP